MDSVSKLCHHVGASVRMTTTEAVNSVGNSSLVVQLSEISGLMVQVSCGCLGGVSSEPLIGCVGETILYWIVPTPDRRLPEALLR